MPVLKINLYDVTPTLSNHSGKIVIVCIVAVAMAIGCSEDHPIYPSYDELMQRGFYIYVLPEGEIEQREWLQEVTIWSWDRHCKGIEPGETFNPINVAYHSKTGQLEFAIKIGPWSMAWDHREPTAEIKLDTLWAMGDVAIYYTSGDYTYLKFKDRFGIPVQVSSRLSITEMVQLLNQIEYVGPPSEAITSPWDISKCGNP